MLAILLLALTVAPPPATKPPREKARPLFRMPKAVRDLAPEVLAAAKRLNRNDRMSMSTVHPETESSPDQVWEAITTANPRIMWHNRSATYRTIRREPEHTVMERWEGLRVGDTLFIDIHAIPHTPALDLAVGLEVRQMDKDKKLLEFGYTDVGPASGTQRIQLEPKWNKDGTIGTRVHHSSAFKGRSLIEHLAYRPVHRLVLHDLWKSIFTDAARFGRD